MGQWRGERDRASPSSSSSESLKSSSPVEWELVALSVAKREEEGGADGLEFGVVLRMARKARTTCWVSAGVNFNDFSAFSMSETGHQRQSWKER